MAAALTEDFPTIAGAAELIRSRRLSPVELTETCLERVRRLDGRINSFIRLDEEGALRRARKAEREIAEGLYRGPLHGIPIGLKDVFDRRAVATTAHSKAGSNVIAANDAAVVQRLDEAGAIDLGKLALHEFALGGPSFDLPWPPARNPWDINRFTQGSSSGTAAAIAAGLILAGPGTDTAGSIRAPAAACGLAGLKPTSGLISRAGMVPLSPSLDCVGPMAWTVEDCALLLQVMVGFDPLDSSSVEAPASDYRAALEDDIRGLRIGVVRHFHEQDNVADSETQAAIEAALAVYRSLGAEVRDIKLAPLGDYAAAGGVIMICEAYRAYAATLRERPDAFGRIFRNRVSAGIIYDSEDLERAYEVQRRLRAAFLKQVARVDILLTATLPAPAPLIDKVPAWPNIERPSLMTPFNLIGGPAMAVCCGFSAEGLPLSLQIAGRPFDDAMVLRAAHAYEQATPWRRRRPALASEFSHPNETDLIEAKSGC